MLLLGALVLVAAQTPPIPFDEAGKALLELAGHDRAKGASVPSQIAARIRPQHERLRLGALELWVPKRVLDDELAAKPGPGPKEVAAIAAELVALQREWLDRLGARGEPVEAASAALATLEGWAK